MDGASRLEVVVADLHFVIELLASEDEPDLADLDSLLLLERLLDLQHGVVWLEVVALFPAS